MSPTRRGYITAEDLERRAFALLEKHRIQKPPVDVDAIALEEGLSFELTTFSVASGAYVGLGDGHGRALIARGESAVRQRYSKAHELAHHLIDRQHETWQLAPSFRGHDRHWPHEKFAAYLLMPRGWVIATVEHAMQNGRSGAQLVERVARVFDVSRAAAAVRLRELGYEEAVK